MLFCHHCYPGCQLCMLRRDGISV
uniref:Uncharacterized protein n=1 Tax=Anguilla anguilla TaxID=7936 RepID=A0A0E9RNF8_ANGAN